MCPSTLFIYSFILMFSLMLFHPKLLWVHARGWGWGCRVFICGHGHRAKKWRTVGQKVTYSGPKSDVRKAEKWRTGQNATLECYNVLHNFQICICVTLLILSISALVLCWGVKYHNCRNLNPLAGKYWYICLCIHPLRICPYHGVPLPNI